MYIRIFIYIYINGIVYSIFGDCRGRLRSGLGTWLTIRNADFSEVLTLQEPIPGEMGTMPSFSSKVGFPGMRYMP